jgi:hypothetical protein
VDERLGRSVTLGFSEKMVGLPGLCFSEAMPIREGNDLT